MASLQDMLTAVEKRSAAVKYKKVQGAGTGKGERYEECVLALVLLRCLKEGLEFQLASNNADAGKFDDEVLAWGAEDHPNPRILFAQLKHKECGAIQRTEFLSEAPNCDFGLRKYCKSYEVISKQIEKHKDKDTATFILMTNRPLSGGAKNMFERLEGEAVSSVPGLELLKAGGEVYKLNQEDQEVMEALQGNKSFVSDFYLLCQQSNSDKIERDLHEELKGLLGAGDLFESISYYSDKLCKNVRKWMNKRKGVCFTKEWSIWQELVDEYIKKEVTRCKVVTTSLVYSSVADVWDYVESNNPAWVTPPEKRTAPLSATKIHQALAEQKQTHIMVTVEQYSELRRQILCCWGPFCPWLVIVDDDRESSSVILDELVKEIQTQRQTQRRLVIVSWRGNNCFGDTCRSSDIIDVSWNKLLDVPIRLNGDCYECHLRDLVAGVDSLKSLLDGQPALLLALVRLSQPLRMGQELKTLPSYYIPRKLVDHELEMDEFFKSLGQGDVCVTDSASCERLKRELGRDSAMSITEIERALKNPSELKWPLLVSTDKLETQEIVKNHFSIFGQLTVYILQLVKNKWKPFCSHVGPTPSNPNDDRQQHKQLSEVLEAAGNTVILEGIPGVGKSEMLSHVAKEIKGKDPACWVMRVNLSEFHAVLENSDSGLNTKQHILRGAVFNKDELGRLEYELLDQNLLNSTRAVCLVDGFDEVCPDYVHQCLEALDLLAPQKGKLLVTTRPAVVVILQDHMGVVAHSLEPFSKSELKDFFRRHPLRQNMPRISDLNENLRDLLRIPLFAYMFAEVLKKRDETYNIVTLYEAFFQKKLMRLYKEKWGDNLSAPGKKRKFKKEQEEHEKQLMALAQSVLLHNKDVPAMSSADREDFVRAGIVYEFANGSPMFVHRTFAEHFLAKWCFLEDGKQSRAEVYREAYKSKRMEFFRESFDRIAVRDRPLLEPMLEAVLGGAEDKVMKLLDRGGAEDKVMKLLDRGVDPRDTDRCGRNALHLLAAYGLNHCSSLLRRLCDLTEKELLSAEDGLLGWTPMRYAAERADTVIGHYLLAEGDDLRNLGSFTTEPPSRELQYFKSRMPASASEDNFSAMDDETQGDEASHPRPRGCPGPSQLRREQLVYELRVRGAPTDGTVAELSARLRGVLDRPVCLAGEDVGEDCMSLISEEMAEQRLHAAAEHFANQGFPVMRPILSQHRHREEKMKRREMLAQLGVLVYSEKHMESESGTSSHSFSSSSSNNNNRSRTSSIGSSNCTTEVPDGCVPHQAEVEVVSPACDIGSALTDP